MKHGRRLRISGLWLGLCLAGWVLWPGTTGADTLVLSDGRRLSGQISLQGDRYVVRTPTGITTSVERRQVREWVVEDAPPPKPTLPSVRPRSTTPPAPEARTDRTAGASAAAAAAEHLQRAREALEANDLAAARDACLAALKADRDNVPALGGLGYAYASLGDLRRARQLLERVCVLRGGAGRANVLNMASVQLSLKNPMRGVRFVRAYLAAHPQTTDQQMVDTLGTLLSHADRAARQGPVYQDARRLYEQHRSRLSGQQTPPADAASADQQPAGEGGAPQGGDEKADAEEMAAQRADRLAELEDLLAAREGQLQQAQDRLKAAQENRRRNAHDGVDVEQLQEQITRQQTEYDGLQAEYEQLSSTTAQQPAPDATATVAQLPLVSPLEAGPEEEAPEDPAAPADDAGGDGATPAEAGAAAKPATPAGGARRRGPARQAAAFVIAPELLVTAAEVVDGAARIHVEGSDGASQPATVERGDAASGLALLRVRGLRSPPLGLADRFDGGALSCACLPREDLFQPVPQLIDGEAPKPNGGAAWSVSLKRPARLPGAPLLADGKLVGVELCANGGDSDNLPAVPLETLRKFLGRDAGAVEFDPEPTSVIYQVTAAYE